MTTDSGESISTLKGIFEKLNIGALAELGSHIIFTGDLKFLQLIFGIKTGHAKYPCPWCWWCATGTNRDPVDATCAERDVAKDVHDFIALGSERGNSSRCHGQQDLPCLPLHLLENPKRWVSPCTLHIGLGLVNALDKSMVNAAGEDIVTEELYRPANVTKSPYQGGTFQGNECRRIVRTAASRGWKDPHPLAPYRTLFEIMDKMYSTAFSDRRDLGDTDIAEITDVVHDFVKSWQSSSHCLELTSPLKLHVLAVHVLEFTELHRATPAAFGEQDGESSHRLFAQLLDTFRMMGPKALIHTVKVFNACRF